MSIDRMAASVERAILGAVDTQAAALAKPLEAALRKVASVAAQAVEAGRDPVEAVSGLSALASVLAARKLAAADAGAETVAMTTGAIETKAAAADFMAARDVWAQRSAAARVTQVSETTRQMIRRKVRRALARNTPPRQLADELRKSIGGRAANMRAQRIARTELHNAAMYGQHQEADRMARENGQRYVKVWRSTRDARTRKSHRLADGQSRPITEPFIVGGEPLMHPGAEGGSARNVVNCRCTTTIVPEKSAQLSGTPTVREITGGLRAQLGQLQAEARFRGRLAQIDRGGSLPEGAARKLYGSLAQETLQRGRVLAAPNSMSVAERAAFEALGKRRGVRLFRNADLPDGAIAMQPRPPMLLQLASEVDDTLLFNDLLTLLMHGLDEVVE